MGPEDKESLWVVQWMNYTPNSALNVKGWSAKSSGPIKATSVFEGVRTFEPLTVQVLPSEEKDILLEAVISIQDAEETEQIMVRTSVDFAGSASTSRANYMSRAVWYGQPLAKKG